uniref:Uncharacterized protein n=1 Tax=Meloidogyne enterolobii TaxID=390850 RepID=A0A6V7WRC8_MELEN|nr:unnamed protein product [Meloidogyne enterolobii]
MGSYNNNMFIVIWLIVLLQFLLIFGCIGCVLLYMYIQYKKIRKDKEHVRRLQQKYLLAHKAKF